MSSPLHQFQIETIAPFELGGLHLPFTNAALFAGLAALLASVFLVGGLRRGALVPGRWQAAAEVMYGFVASMVQENAGEKAKPFVPFMLTVFMLIFFGNLLGMIPGGFTFTGQVSATMTLAMVVFLLIVMVGFIKQGLGFFRIFLPSGIPWFLAPLMVVIETIVFLARPFTLALRLFMNMFAGHLMLKIFAGFVVSMGAALGVGGYFLGILPMAFIVALTGLELFVAALQAYIFAILSSVYLHDALSSGH
ncbi:MAG: F0F1 ATP synthase subunit A [Alphaproteobacteria bacterium]|nr:MAG: F0F1 ATP synthase subunit A [Alphaproteobacteria bacterium]